MDYEMQSASSLCIIDRSGQVDRDRRVTRSNLVRFLPCSDRSAWVSGSLIFMSIPVGSLFMYTHQTVHESLFQVLKTLYFEVFYEKNEV